MAPKSDRGFPCFLWLSDRLSEQDNDFEEKPGSGYVFFDPSVDLKRSDERSLNYAGRCRGLSRASTGVSADASDLPSRNESSGDTDAMDLKVRRL